MPRTIAIKVVQEDLIRWVAERNKDLLPNGWDRAHIQTKQTEIPGDRMVIFVYFEEKT